MSRLDWTTFLAAHPKAHLLAGLVPEPNPTVLKRLRRLMQALIDERGAGRRLRHGDRAPPRHHRDPMRASPTAAMPSASARG